MTFKPLTQVAYAAAQGLYARHQAGDELEFEQEMDAFLPEQLLLCRLDEAFQEFRAKLDAIAGSVPLQASGHEHLAALMATAVSALESSHQAFVRRYVHDEPVPG